MFSVAKAKRQLQSAQPERKSTSLYGDEPVYLAFIPTYLFYIKGVCCLDEKSCIFGP